MTSTDLEDKYQEAVNILARSYYFDFVRKIGSGTYGVVLTMKDRNRNKDVAVKMVTHPNKAETKEWPRLLHPNIIPLHDYFHLRNGVTVFIMPHMKCPLLRLVGNKAFRSKSRSFNYVGRWIYQLLCGLNYLHLRSLYHLDVKLGNELISYNHTAVLCDFSFLAKRETITVGLMGMPDVYRPPEVCHLEESQSNVKGIQFNSESLDLWAFGIMCLEAYTRQALYQNPLRSREEDGRVPIWKGWDVDVRPFLDRIREDVGYLLGILQATYPCSSVSENDVSKLIDFVQQFINENPQHRIPTRKALKHCFLKSWNRYHTRNINR